MRRHNDNEDYVKEWKCLNSVLIGESHNILGTVDPIPGSAPFSPTILKNIICLFLQDLQIGM